MKGHYAMLRKTSLPTKQELDELKIAEEEMLRVSSAKPLGSLEKGEYEGRLIKPRCIRYVPEKLIDQLMTKKDIYILSPKYDGEEKIEWKGTYANHPNILLLESKGALIENRTMIFHKEALKQLLELNKGIVVGMLNIEKINEYSNKRIPLSKEKYFQRIDDSAVIAFVELVSRKEFSESIPRDKALVNAAFADSDLFFKNECWRKIQLTKELNEYFIQKQPRFSQWDKVDWKAIAKEYKEARAFRRSPESKELVNNVISKLAKGDKTLQNLDQINQYIKKYPERRLSQIILSKIQNHQETAKVHKEFKYK